MYILLKDKAGIILQYTFLIVSKSHEKTRTNNALVRLPQNCPTSPRLVVALSPKPIRFNWRHKSLKLGHKYRV